MASKSVEPFMQGAVCDRRQTDRQTDHAMEKCVGIGGIACAARAIPPKKVSTTLQVTHLTATERHLPYAITVLPATRHGWMCPVLTPAKQASTRFTYRGGIEGWVDPGVWLYTEMICPSAVIQPSKWWPDSEFLNPQHLITSPTPNCYTTKRPK